MNFFFSTEAKCDSITLSTTISGIESSINQTQSDIQTINDAKKNLRLAIDCRVNSDNRDEIFEHYQALFTREAYMTNVIEDLKIKKEILEKEKQRCEARSKTILFHSIAHQFKSFSLRIK